jgi:hypothetical protein
MIMIRIILVKGEEDEANDVFVDTVFFMFQL